MDDFLDADCVINALVLKGVLKNKSWKITKGTTTQYYVNFDFIDSARIIGFVIYIKGTFHCIGITALNNNARRFNVPVDDIIVKCAIE